MNRSLTVLVLLVATLAISASAYNTYSIPSALLAWSSFDGVANVDQQTNRIHSDMLHDIVKQFSSNPEIVVVFASSELRTDALRDGSFSNLENVFNQASSSLVMPYTFGSSADAISELQSSFAQISSLEELKNKLTEYATNQKTELLILNLSGDNDEIVAEVSTLLKDIDYVALAVPTEEADKIKLDFVAPPFPTSNRRSRSVSSTLVVQDDSTDDDPVYQNRWPPGVIVGLFNAAMLIFFGVLGFVVMMAIQTPQRFEGGEKKQS